MLTTESVTHYIARFLGEAGVKGIWGVTADSLDGLSDSLHRLNEIRWMGKHYEEAGL